MAVQFVSLSKYIFMGDYKHRAKRALFSRATEISVF